MLATLDKDGYRIPGRRPARYNGYLRRCEYYQRDHHPYVVEPPGGHRGAVRCLDCLFPAICLMEGVDVDDRPRTCAHFLPDRPTATLMLIPYVINGSDTGTTTVRVGRAVEQVEVPLARMRRKLARFRTQ